jgi:hypothetical protein
MHTDMDFSVILCVNLIYEPSLLASYPFYHTVTEVTEQQEALTSFKTFKET